MYLDNMEQKRKDRKLTLQDIATFCGVTKQTVFTWEKNCVIPNAYTDRICHLLHLDPSQQEFASPQAVSAFRQELQLSPLYFSALIGVDVSTVKRWESGDIDMSKKNTMLLHELYVRYYQK